jgi:hypothetical protein
VHPLLTLLLLALDRCSWSHWGLDESVQGILDTGKQLLTILQVGALTEEKVGLTKIIDGKALDQILNRSKACINLDAQSAR